MRALLKHAATLVATFLMATIATHSGAAATDVAAGASHSCAVVNGGVQCWGNNFNGQLGNNSTTGSLVPVQAIAAGSNATAVATGQAHSCAVVNGGVQCWGLNAVGQLGNGSIIQSLVPVQAIAALSNATAVAAGTNGNHSCAVVNGGVQCWGSNFLGYLGNNSSIDSAVPVQAIAALSNVTAVSAGGNHSCAVVNGGVRCWGMNNSGELGDNSTINSPIPVQSIAALSGVTDVAASSNHTCMVANGGVQCWGSNFTGELGDNSTTSSLLPVQPIAALSSATGVAAGNGFSCAVVNGGVQCWGTNPLGQLGNNSVTQSLVPVQAIAALGNATVVANGNNHSCAVVNGGVQCWGNNGFGKLGNNSATQSLVPVQTLLVSVPNAPTIGVAVAGNGSATVAYSPPGSDGGSPITGYTATSNPGGITGTVTSGPIIVTGLTNGTPYTFTVTATNAIGTGSTSAPSNSVTPTAAASAICQFNQPSGAWNVPANWNNCSSGNGAPLGTPGPADRAEITGGRTAILPAGTFNLKDLFLQDGTLQGAGIGATTITTAGALFTAWGGPGNTLTSMSLNLGAGFSLDTTSGALAITNAELITNSGTTTVGPVAIAGSGARIQMTGGTAYRATGNHTMVAGGVFQNSSGVFKAMNSLTINGTFISGGNFEIPAGVVVTLTSAVTFSHVDPVFSLIFGDGTLSAVGQTLTLATGGVRGGALTFNVGTLNNTGATLRPAPSFGIIGLITINGNYIQSGAAVIDFNLAGTLPSQYDRLVVSGSVTLGGSLNRGAIGSFAPPVGTVLDIITAGSVSGTFSSGSEVISFDAPRRFIEVISATKVSLAANETVWVVDTSDDVSPTVASLRNALTRFNAESGSGCINGPYAIHFLLGVSDTTIQPATALPAINGCPGLLIDGYTQSGATLNSSVTDWNANLAVTFEGLSCAGCSGFTVNAANTVVRGINFTNWQNAGIFVNNGGTGARIRGNYFFQGVNGVYHNGAADVHIGQIGVADARNVIVKATQAGIYSTMQSGGLPLLVENNLIGAGASLLVGANAKGILVAGSNNVKISENIIVNNGKGIAVLVGTGIDYSGNNKIYANGIAVDLNDDGASANDEASPPYDTDAGGNLRLNFPTIVSLTPTSGTTATINYQMKTNAGAGIEVFFCRNPSGSPQCETPVASTNFSADAMGLFTGSFGIGGLAAGMPVTMFAHATSGPKAGNLSEISPSVAFVVGLPAITVSGTTSFPATTVGASSATQAITLTNSGTATLTINSITHTGASLFPDTTGGPAPNAAHWCGFGSAIGGAPNTGVPISIAPSGSCVMNIIFAPTAATTFSATVTINSDAPTSPTAILLNGNGIAAASTPTMTVAFAPASVNNGVNSTMTLTLTNPNASPATISIGGAVSVPGLTMTSLVDGCGASASISAGTIDLGMAGSIPAMGSCTITVQAQSAFAGSFPVTVSPGNLITSLGNNTNTSTSALTVTPPVPITSLLLESPVGNTGTASANSTTGALVGLKLVITTTAFSPGFTAGSFTITYPAGVVTNTLPAVVNSCGGTITAVAGGNTISGSGLALGGSNQCSIRVSVVSAATGIYPFAFPIGALSTSIGSNATASSATLTITAAAAPAVTLAPTSIAFGSRTVNTTSPNSLITLTNSGAANLVISSITSSGDFGFTSTCPISTPPLTAAANCNINITFTPLTVAALTGNVTITSNAPGSPHVISLSGTGAAVAVPGISLPATTLNLGNVPIGSAGTQSITVTNTGLATLNLTSITVTGSGFVRGTPATGTPPNCGASVAPSGQCQIAITFTASAVGAATGQINIVHNATGSPTSIALTATAIPLPTPGISAPGSIAFGDQIIASSGTQALTITNTGTATLNVSAISLSGTDAASFVQSGTCASIAAGASCAITITFTPTTIGIKSGQITIASNANGQPSVTVAITGNGILAPRPIVELSVTAIGYGNNIFGGATASQNVMLRNAGGVALAIQSVNTVGDFVLANGCPASLASTASCVISIQFSPLGVGGRTGELVVNTNAGNSPHRVPLSGTGCRWFSQATSRFYLTSCSN